MNFDEYQQRAMTTAMYPDIGQNPFYPALGLGGEVGEVLNNIKKIQRDHAGLITSEIQHKLVGELGDVLWYLAVLSEELGLSFQGIAAVNLEKLASRKERGTIQGSGGDR